MNSERVIAAIKRGEVVILPLEHSYAYACDAFSYSAVNRLHQLRNDPKGVVAQVVVGRANTLEGIAQNVSTEVKNLVAEFWPGLLTLKIAPNQNLNWDLGDAGALGEFAVRMPNQIQTLEVMNKTGPLAIASATLAGMAPLQIAPVDPNLEALDIGELTPGPLSTVITEVDGKLTISRLGAHTLEELRKVASAIEVVSD